MLQRLRHPNILNFYGACFDCQPVCASSANIVCMSVQCNNRCAYSAEVELLYVRVGTAVLAQHHLQDLHSLQHACSTVSVEAQVFHKLLLTIASVCRADDGCERGEHATLVSSAMRVCITQHLLSWMGL